MTEEQPQEQPIEEAYFDKHLEIRQLAELAQIEVFSDSVRDTSVEVEKYRLIARVLLDLIEELRSRGPAAGPQQQIVDPSDVEKLEKLVGVTEHMRTKLEEARAHRDSRAPEAMGKVDWKEGAPPGLEKPHRPPFL